MGVPVNITAEEKQTEKAREYKSLLAVDGKMLPDPFFLEENWEG